MTEVNKGVHRPNALAEFVTGDKLARIVEQGHQDLKGLTAELNANAVPPQFTSAEVRFKRAKPDAAMVNVRHSKTQRSPLTE